MKSVILLVGIPLFATPTHADCDYKQRGTGACPTITAPAETAVPGPSMGGSVLRNGGPLFNGVTPPNGFMVQMNAPSALGNNCWVNDNPNGLAGANTAPSGYSGFLLGGFGTFPNSDPNPYLFVTPPGYRPMGPVSVSCSGGQVPLEVRAW
jgi:hypothetical protein